MKKLSKTIAMLAITGAVLTGCGNNPMGSGAQGGLSIFAKIGKAMSKPAAVNDQQSSKDGSKSTLATGPAKRFLGKAAGGQVASGVVSRGFETVGGGEFKYYEVVSEKTNDDDSMKVSTGRGEVAFRYSTGTPDTASFNMAFVTDIISWSFVGRERKTWNNEIDSIRATVNFSSTDINDPKPGATSFWARNITGDVTLGDGDTAAFDLSTLDDVNHTQSGTGHFYDAHSGNTQDGEAKSFDFDVQILFKNTVDPSKPYSRYQDNDGIMTFTLPWGQNTLYYNIHFYSQNALYNGTYDRVCDVYKNDANGPRIIHIEANERTGRYIVIFYDDKANETSRETN